jgi:hypothetical protein
MRPRYRCIDVPGPVVLLSERLDQHRGRGQQQIILKHVTVNADQVVVADQIVRGKDVALLTSGTEKPMENLSHDEAVPVPRGRNE